MCLALHIIQDCYLQAFAVSLALKGQSLKQVMSEGQDKTWVKELIVIGETEPLVEMCSLGYEPPKELIPLLEVNPKVFRAIMDVLPLKALITLLSGTMWSRVKLEGVLSSNSAATRLSTDAVAALRKHNPLAEETAPQLPIMLARQLTDPNWVEFFVRDNSYILSQILEADPGYWECLSPEQQLRCGWDCLAGYLGYLQSKGRPLAKADPVFAAIVSRKQRELQTPEMNEIVLENARRDLPCDGILTRLRREALLGEMRSAMKLSPGCFHESYPELIREYGITWKDVPKDWVKEASRQALRDLERGILSGLMKCLLTLRYPFPDQIATIIKYYSGDDGDWYYLVTPKAAQVKQPIVQHLLMAGRFTVLHKLAEDGKEVAIGEDDMPFLARWTQLEQKSATFGMVPESLYPRLFREAVEVANDELAAFIVPKLSELDPCVCLHAAIHGLSKTLQALFPRVEVSIREAIGRVLRYQDDVETRKIYGVPLPQYYV